jgi:hypothetical protein
LSLSKNIKFTVTQKIKWICSWENSNKVFSSILYPVPRRLLTADDIMSQVLVLPYQLYWLFFQWLVTSKVQQLFIHTLIVQQFQYFHSHRWENYLLILLEHVQFRYFIANNFLKEHVFCYIFSGEKLHFHLCLFWV